MSQFLKEKIRKFQNWFYAKVETSKRMVFWAKAMKYSYDFDAHTIYEMLYFKLDRIYKTMKNDGHCLWNSNINNKAMRELREARELAKRLSNSSKYYQLRAFKETSKKYGKLKSWTERIEGKQFSEYKSLWGGTQKVDKVARKFYKRRNLHWNYIYKEHKDRFFYLLNKRTDSWWD